MSNYNPKARFINKNDNSPNYPLTIGKTYCGYVTWHNEFKVLYDDEGGVSYLNEGEYKLITNEKYILINL